MNTRIVLKTDDVEQQVIEFEGDNFINFDFQNIETNGNRKFNSFYLRPQEVINAITAYLNSVPSQQMINEEVNKPSNIMNNTITPNE